MPARPTLGRAAAWQALRAPLARAQAALEPPEQRPGSGANSAGTGGAAGSHGGSGGAPGKAAACKRGVAYGRHSIADLQALSAGVSWWYNWDFRPDKDLRAGAYLEAGVEYVPMIWGAASDRSAAKTAIGDDATALLGFNEPNFGAQANLSATAAAAPLAGVGSDRRCQGSATRLARRELLWRQLSGHRSLPLYLDAFFAACAGCRVDAIAIHIYVGCSPAGDNKAEWLIQHVETYKKRFSQPFGSPSLPAIVPRIPRSSRHSWKTPWLISKRSPASSAMPGFPDAASNVAHVDSAGGQRRAHDARASVRECSQQSRVYALVTGACFSPRRPTVGSAVTRSWRISSPRSCTRIRSHSG